MDMVYIAAPYSAQNERVINDNIKTAIWLGRKAIEDGKVPFVPHLMYPMILDDNNPEERKLGIQLDLEVINKCDEFWYLASRITKGMQQEIEYAKSKGLEVKAVSAPDDVDRYGYMLRMMKALGKEAKSLEEEELLYMKWTHRLSCYAGADLEGDLRLLLGV